jgi:hypothetical protein
MNGLFTLGGVAVGSLSATLAPWIERRGARKDKVADREYEARKERLAKYGAFLAAADQVSVLVRGKVNLGPKFQAAVLHANDQELSGEETTAMATARQTASQAVLIATPTTQAAIETFVQALAHALVQPDLAHAGVGRPASRSLRRCEPSCPSRWLAPGRLGAGQCPQRVAVRAPLESAVPCSPLRDQASRVPVVTHLRPVATELAAVERVDAASTLEHSRLLTVRAEELSCHRQIVHRVGGVRRVFSPYCCSAPALAPCRPPAVPRRVSAVEYLPPPPANSASR